MPDGEHPIDAYIIQLARRLHLPAVERDQVLGEVRGHLEERAGALHETGVPEEHAERQAVQAFGPVGRISQELRAAHPTAWGTRRWLIGMLTGAVVIYALYLVESVPLLIYQFQPSYNGPPLDPMGIWNVSTGSMVGYFWSMGGYPFWITGAGYSYPVGQLWVLLPFLVLYPVLPFLWGRRAQHWWVPGLAYGLGTCLVVIVELFNVTVYNRMVLFRDPYVNRIPFAWISAASLTLALAASFAGWLWRERSASALARAQAA